MSQPVFNRFPAASRLSPPARSTTRGLIVQAAVLSCLLCVFTQPLRGQDWPGFHGLDIAGVVADGKLPESFIKQQPRWTFDLEHRDVGSMAVQDGRVYLLAMDPSDKMLIRLMSIDLESGKLNWSKAYPHAENHLHSRNTLASSTPATDDDYVYIAHSDREHTWLRCLDHGGKEIWSRDFGSMQSQHGFGTSPTVHGDVVLLNFSQQGAQVKQGEPGVSRVIAVERKTGQTIWETPVTTRHVCYGVPAVHDGKVLCANTGDGLYALSLRTGEMLWRLPVFTKRCVSSPIVVGDLVIGTTGSGGGGNYLVAARMPSDPSGQPTEVYRIEKFAPYVPTSVVHDGLMFAVDDRGIASCFNVQTGESEWTKRIGGNFGASPILIGDTVVIISLNGEATLLRAAKEFETIATIDLGGPVGATPAFADGKLLVRVENELRCY